MKEKQEELLKHLKAIHDLVKDSKDFDAKPENVAKPLDNCYYVTLPDGRVIKVCP